MKETSLSFLPVLALLLASGCAAVADKPRREVVVVESHRPGPPPWAPAHGWRRKHETYYYYPAIQVYYYPHVRKYYWLDGGDWKFGVRLPRRYVIAEHERIVLDLDYEPHKHHGKIKHLYPPGRYKKHNARGRFW